MRDTTLRLVHRLLDAAGHVELVQRLSTIHFCALVRDVGLEDCAELLVMATPEQVLALLDEVAWEADAPGVDEHFDAGRFAVWLEVLLEGTDALVAERLAALPEELLSAALCAQLFVLDLDALGHALAGASSNTAELAERVLDESLYLEFNHYTLVAKHQLGWDPTLAALLILDQHEHELLFRVLERCLAATTGELDRSGEGLHTVLRAQQTLEVDAFAERDDRRSRAGHVSRSSAAAFLTLAAETPVDDPSALREDPLTRAYFREREGPSGAARSSAAQPDPPQLVALTEHLDALAVAPEPTPEDPPRALPSSEEIESNGRALRVAMERLRIDDPLRHQEQLARLAYLANVLLASADLLGRAHDPLEAARLALEHSAAGFVHLRGPRPDPVSAWRVLEQFGLDGLFRLGWSLAARAEALG